MSPNEAPQFEAAPRTVAPKIESAGIVVEQQKSDPQKEAVLRCSRVFGNNENFPGQERDIFFDYLKKQEKGPDCYKILSACSEESLRSLFTAKKGFEEMANPDGIEQILLQAVDSDKQAVDSDKQAVDSDKQAVDSDKQGKIEEQKKILSELRDKIKNHPHISDKNKEIINRNNDPSSHEFKEATKAILAELKAHAQNSKNPEDLREYASMVEQFHSIGAVSSAEFAVFKRELSEMAKAFQEGKDAGQKAEFKLPEGFRADKSTDGVYTKFADGFLKDDRFDEVVTLDKDGKGSKDIISARSGYRVHLDDIVDLKEQGLIVQESQLHSAMDNYDATIKKTDAFREAQEKIEKESTDPQKKEEARENVKKAQEYKEQQTQKLQEKRGELVTLQKQLSEQQAEKLKNEGTIQSREQEAHKTIDFVDDMGLYTLGVENIDKFFGLVSSKSASGKIETKDGLSPDEKIAIKKAFIGLLGDGGKELFDESGGFKLKEGKTTKDIQNLLKSQPFYHAGEVPPVRYSELEQAMKTKVA